MTYKKNIKNLEAICGGKKLKIKSYYKKAKTKNVYSTFEIL